MTLTAQAAYPYANEERATAGLRGQLREQAAAAGQLPDWSTLAVAEPTEHSGAHGRRWFEWVATVETRPVNAAP
ncbi:hypothetical protein [Geodermatophilus sp. CPCC 205506]|uniref:hypothetical protein n=1 Tax=Geodermatophilus sp. CPCC 205506 TaxID=2936596 RepID=UPI003EEBB0B7